MYGTKKIEISGSKMGEIAEIIHELFLNKFVNYRIIIAQERGENIKNKPDLWV